MNFEKENGIYYTPAELADFICKIGIKSPNDKVFDPCFGEGSLISSAYKRLKNLDNNNPKNNLFGIDINPNLKKVDNIEIIKLFNKGNLKKKDFLTPIENKYSNSFDIIIMNPPFIRHHNISKNLQKKIKELSSIKQWNISATSDMWVYFILQSLEFLKNGGKIITILPWSFLSTDYSKKLRTLLIDKFKEINLYIFNKHFFKNTEEKILVLFLNGFNNQLKHIHVKYYEDVPNKVQKGNRLSKMGWINNPWIGVNKENIDYILNKFSIENGFQLLGNYAKISIGIVTGANDFFIINDDKVEQLEIPLEILKPIINKSKKLNQLSIIDINSIEDKLLCIPKGYKLYSNLLKKYINEGKTKKIHLMYHPRKRNKWYTLEVNHPPDAFFHYITKEIPYLVINKAKIYSTNTIHNVNFNKNINKNTIEWIQLSMFSSLSQISIEEMGRKYGGGVLKIEPGKAGNILIYPGNGKNIPMKIKNKINSFLFKGERKQAMNIVDNWFCELGILKKDDIKLCNNIYSNLRSKRM